MTSADRLRVRIQQLADEKGNEFILGLLRRALMVGEEGATKRISRWNDGIYRNVCFNGGVGL